MLTEAVRSYLAFRRAGGYELVNIEPILLSFAEHAAGQGDEFVRVQTAVAWASLGRSRERRHTRLRAVAAFARYARAEDARHEIVPRQVFGRGYRRPTPFVFTPEQLQALMAAARRLGPADSLRPRTYATLFGLLAATGLRVSEALALGQRDITTDGLLIRETKFRKTRLAPLHASVARALQQYIELRRAFGAGDEIFIGSDGSGLKYEAVKMTFARLARKIGLAGHSHGPRARLHCLRHTFAVRALESCPRDVHDIARHQMGLLTYLGHSHLESTYWYLQATPHLLREIAADCEAHAGGGGT